MMSIANIIKMNKILTVTFPCKNVYFLTILLALLKTHYFYLKIDFHVIAQTSKGFISKHKFAKIAAISQHLKKNIIPLIFMPEI